MPLYNFQKRFAAAVKIGTKRRTLRNPRKRATKVGDSLYMYSGLRTKQTEKLGVFICTNVSDVIVNSDSIQIGQYKIPDVTLTVFKYNFRSADRLDNFAQLDGFPDFKTMQRWIIKVHGSLPWHCEMIEW